MNKFDKIVQQIVEQQDEAWHSFIVNSKKEYIKKLLSIYTTANQADTDRKQSWQDNKQTSSHCNPIGKIIKDVAGTKFWDYITENGGVDWSLLK